MVSSWRPFHCFPAFTAPKRDRRPGAVPIGLQRASPEARSRWRADSFRFPPFQCGSRFGPIYKDDISTWRLPSVQERHLLLVFRCFHTEPCFFFRTGFCKSCCVRVGAATSAGEFIPLWCRGVASWPSFLPAGRPSGPALYFHYLPSGSSYAFFASWGRSPLCCWSAVWCSI